MSDPKNPDPNNADSNLENAHSENTERNDATDLEPISVQETKSEDSPRPSRAEISKVEDAEVDAPKPETKSESQDPPTAASAAPQTGKVKKSRLWLPVSFNFILTLALIAVVVMAGFWFYPRWQQQQVTIGELQSQIAAEKNSASASVNEISQQMANVQKASDQALQKAQAQAEALDKQLRAVTERLNAHNQRLLSLSNTSREDWMLAEAQYLLRLASQRLLVDRQATSALGLMESVDGILQELAMPDLFSVRQALANDLAKVRLASEVDREGLYLRLDGLINNMEQLPMYQNPAAAKAAEVSEATEASDSVDMATSDASGAWAWVKRQAAAVGDKLSQYFILQRHDQPTVPLLPPSEAEYLRQNIRLSLEQAQVAMLREQNEVYAASLGEAMDLVQRYFPSSPARKALLAELNQLQGKPIAVELPQINSSIEQLQAYIERLHQLGASGKESQAE